ncbi:MAG: hypothetical protein MK194_12315 [Roseibacillus sp.]|nr:hypothetical protein [Roseibacillus sp.]
MISAGNLTEEQVSAMKQWAEEGSDLSDIQKRLKGQFGLNVTYMDTRLLVLDLGIEIISEADDDGSPEPEEVEPAAGEEAVIVDPGEAEVGEADSPGGSVQVTTDEISRPGSVISGTVTFSDGEKAIWLIDEYGRPGLDPETSGYQPTEADLGEFEKHLRTLLQG